MGNGSVGLIVPIFLWLTYSYQLPLVDGKVSSAE